MSFMDYRDSSVRLRMAGLALIADGGVEAVVIRNVADCLDPAVRKSHGVAAPGHPTVAPLLRPVVVHAAVLVIHAKIVGVRFWLIILFNKFWMMRKGMNRCWMWERMKRSWPMMNWSWRRRWGRGTEGDRSWCRRRPRWRKVRLRSLQGLMVNRSEGGEVLGRGELDQGRGGGGRGRGHGARCQCCQGGPHCRGGGRGERREGGDGGPGRGRQRVRLYWNRSWLG